MLISVGNEINIYKDQMIVCLCIKYLTLFVVPTHPNMDDCERVEYNTLLYLVFYTLFDKNNEANWLWLILSKLLYNNQ